MSVTLSIYGSLFPQNARQATNYLLL